MPAYETEEEMDLIRDKINATDAYKQTDSAYDYQNSENPNDQIGTGKHQRYPDDDKNSDFSESLKRQKI